MLITKPNRKLQRPGGIAPLTCILLILILGAVAFAVDVSWMTLTASELQNVADAAALAGANKLGDNLVLHSLGSQTAANKTALRAAAVSIAKTTAKDYATYNSAGGVTMSLLDADIDVGFTNSAGVYTSYATDNSNYPNTVKVKARRDSSANTSLGLFFGPVLGVSKMDMSASATATIYSGTISSLKTGGNNSGMLPVTFDVNDWDNFINTGKDKAGVKSTDGSGNPILQIYGTVKDTGNFGLLSLNDSHVGSSTLADWIHNGVPSADIQALKNNGLIPLESHNANLWDWRGDTGFKASNCMDINQHVGKTYILPLFKPFDNSTNSYDAGTGNGSHYDYNIVRFVAIKILTSPKTNKEVWIQPVLSTDPNVVLTNTTPATGTTFTSAITLKLTN